MGRPTKIMIVTAGSRGDVQPFIAIGCALQRAGYTVMVGANENNEQFVKDFGLSFRPIYPDNEAAINDTPSLFESMANGDMFTFLGALDDIAAKNAESVVGRFVEMFREFKPDLFVEGTLAHFCGRFASLLCNIPVMSVKLQWFCYNPKRMVLGLPTLPFGCHKFLFDAAFGGIYDANTKFDKVMVEQFGCKVFDLWTKSDWMEEFTDPWAPEYICQSPTWREPLDIDDHPNVNYVGACVIKAAAQGGESFGGSETMRTIQAFLAAGPTPVYCGWGSMVCKSSEHMVVLASRALMHSGQRGIILSGYAKLSMTVLSKATDDAALLAYAEKNILFVKSAPHEWLFPQVSCTVHHGGVGTLTAALRAGKPTIITPVFLDQWDHAHLVNRLGAGIGFDKQLQKISAEELGDAMRKVVESTEMAAKAKEAGEILQEEDGTQNIVNAVQDFWQEWVESGKYQAELEEKRQERREARRGFFARNFSHLHSCFSLCSPQDPSDPRVHDAASLGENTEILMPSLLNKNLSPAMDEFADLKRNQPVGFEK